MSDRWTPLIMRRLLGESVKWRVIKSGTALDEDRPRWGGNHMETAAQMDNVLVRRVGSRMEDLLTGQLRVKQKIFDLVSSSGILSSS